MELSRNLGQIDIGDASYETDLRFAPNHGDRVNETDNGFALTHGDACRETENHLAPTHGDTPRETELRTARHEARLKDANGFAEI